MLTQSSYDNPFDGLLGLDNPFTESPLVPQPKRTKKFLMPLESIPEFAGTQDDMIQPADFLKVIKRSFVANGMTTSNQKLELFELYLKSDSPAEAWYNDKSTPKKTWAELEAEFRVKFPNIIKATKTKVEIERELAELKIKMEELGKTEKYRGEEVYTHVIFAEKILDLAKQAKMEESTSGLWNVRDNLPETLREKIPEDQGSWREFTQAIKKIDMGHIRDGVRKHNEKTNHDAQINANLKLLNQRTAGAAFGNINSPTREIRTQLASTTIAQQPPSRAAPINPFNSSAGGGGNLFTRPARLPATEAEKTTIRASIALYVIQPETPEGEAAYFEQLRAWRRINGDGPVSKNTGFPLRPGGAPPGSGECYACGRTGHRRVDCQLSSTKRIPLLEANFRAICGSILGQPQRRTAQINYVATSEEDEFAWLNATTSSQQGNGEGPSAL